MSSSDAREDLDAVRVLDHLIVAGSATVSFAERGLPGPNLSGVIGRPIGGEAGFDELLRGAQGNGLEELAVMVDVRQRLGESGRDPVWATLKRPRR